MILDEVLTADELSAQIAEMISDGRLDDKLQFVKQQIDARILAKRRTRTINDYAIGSGVVFNDFCGTAYLRGHTAIVVGRARTKLTVVLDKPVGRFVRMEDGVARSVEIKVPVTIVDPL